MQHPVISIKSDDFIFICLQFERCKYRLLSISDYFNFDAKIFILITKTTNCFSIRYKKDRNYMKVVN